MLPLSSGSSSPRMGRNSPLFWHYLTLKIMTPWPYETKVTLRPVTQHESSASMLWEPQISQWREPFAVLQVDGDRSIPLALYNKLWCDRGTMFISHLDKPPSRRSRIEIFNVHSFETIRQSLRVMLALYHRDSQTRAPAATGRQIIR